MSQRFLDHAQAELDKGHRLQASEKVWGATAHALKAIALKRGWRNRSNTTIFDIGAQLGQEFAMEEDFAKYLALADSMHKNFYENNRRSGDIRLALEGTKQFVLVLDRVRSEPERPFTVRDAEDRERLGNLLGLPRSERPAIGATDPRGFSRPPDDDGNDPQVAAMPPEPQPPDRPTPAAERPPIPDNIQVPADSPQGRRAPPAAIGGRSRKKTPQ